MAPLRIDAIPSVAAGSIWSDVLKPTAKDLEAVELQARQIGGMECAFMPCRLNAGAAFCHDAPLNELPAKTS